MSAMTGTRLPAGRQAGVLQLSIGDVVADPVVQRGQPEILAGHDSRLRPVRWIHVAEYREIASVLRGGEVLFTTGLAFPTKPADQRRWISELADRGVAGLFVELGSVVERVPDAITTEALERDFPLVVLHRPIPFVSVTEALLPRLAGTVADELAAAAAVRDRLTRAALDGLGAAGLVELLGRELGSVAMVARPGGRVVYRSEPGGHPPGEPDGPPPDESIGVRARITVGADDRWGTLYLGPSPFVSPSLAQTVCDEAAALMALVLMRSMERHALGGAQAETFLADLVSDDHGRDELGIHEQAISLGMPLRYASLLPVVVVARRDTRLTSAEWATIVRGMQEALRGLGLSGLAGVPDEGRVLAVCQLPSPGDRGAVATALAGSLHRHSSRSGSRSLCVCVGACADTWLELRAALRAASRSAERLRLAEDRDWHDVSVPMTEDLLWELRDHAVAHAFVERHLGPVVARDQQRGSQLLATLEVYCEQGGNKTQAARALHLERQSLYKRLARLEDVLGVSLDDPDVRARLHLAVLARRVLALGS